MRPVWHARTNLYTYAVLTLWAAALYGCQVAADRRDGSAAAKPVRIRRCPATVKPPRGMSPVACRAPTAGVLGGRRSRQTSGRLAEDGLWTAQLRSRGPARFGPASEPGSPSWPR